MPMLPQARGPITEALFSALRRRPDAIGPLAQPAGARPEADEDLQLALYCCYELHYRGFDDVDERWEWAPRLLAARATLEAPFEAALLEFVVHRSAYQLKEADPHSWAIPRLHGGPKAALVEIQADEYGDGRPQRGHAELFAKTMRELALDDGYGAYLDQLPAATLATVNLMSLCGLHRRLRGAIVGHLALFEMTSSLPNRRYGRGLRRLGFETEAATDFFDEHVVADAVHENLAAVDPAGGPPPQA